MKIRLGEPQFVSVQGEGLRTGVLSVWTRFFGCTLRCKGFMQPNPKDPSTYFDPLEGIDPKAYNNIFDLPVVKYGCDSIYSIDPRFKHCAYDYDSPEAAVDELYSVLPGGKFKHPATGQTYDWCVTGGEPLMNQDKIEAMYEIMYGNDNFPYNIQIETNCTKPLTEKFVNLITETSYGRQYGSTRWFFSMSPKLHSVSGELDEKAWKPEIIKQYHDINPNGWLKIVVNGTISCWEELDRKINQLRVMGVNYPVMIMPVGATKEQQENSIVISNIADKAIEKGYHISGRLHCTIWGNTVGV